MKIIMKNQVNIFFIVGYPDVSTNIYHARLMDDAESALILPSSKSKVLEL